MRVLVLLTDLFEAGGGIQTFNRCLVKALDELASRNRWKVAALALNDCGASELVSRYLRAAQTSYRGFARNRPRFAVAGIQASWNADVILLGHVHFCPLACAMRSVSKYLIVHGVDVWKRLSFLERLGVSRVHRILSVSVSTRNEMARYNNLSPSRFCIFPDTLDPFFGEGSTPQSRDDLGLPKGKIVLTVSRLDARERYKGVDTVIQAVPKVLSKVPDAFYVVVGDGGDRGRLQRIADDLGVSQHIHFAGRVTSSLLPSYYQQCDVFALPSSGEGFGIVFLEAMRFEKPCVGARSGGIPEVVEDGVTGFLVEPGDADGLADRLVCLLHDAALREKMGQAGKDRLEREYSFEKFRTRLEAVLCK